MCGWHVEYVEYALCNGSQGPNRRWVESGVCRNGAFGPWSCHPGAAWTPKCSLFSNCCENIHWMWIKLWEPKHLKLVLHLSDLPLSGSVHFCKPLKLYMSIFVLILSQVTTKTGKWPDISMTVNIQRFHAHTCWEASLNVTVSGLAAVQLLISQQKYSVLSP